MSENVAAYAVENTDKDKYSLSVVSRTPNGKVHLIKAYNRVRRSLFSHNRRKSRARWIFVRPDISGSQHILEGEGCDKHIQFSNIMSDGGPWHVSEYHKTYVFYVDSTPLNGSSTIDTQGDGTSEYPWRNLQYALDCIKACSDLCCVRYVQIHVSGIVDYPCELSVFHGHVGIIFTSTSTLSASIDLSNLRLDGYKTFIEIQGQVILHNIDSFTLAATAIMGNAYGTVIDCDNVNVSIRCTIISGIDFKGTGDTFTLYAHCTSDYKYVNIQHVNGVLSTFTDSVIYITYDYDNPDSIARINMSEAHRINADVPICYITAVYESTYITGETIVIGSTSNMSQYHKQIDCAHLLVGLSSYTTINSIDADTVFMEGNYYSTYIYGIDWIINNLCIIKQYDSWNPTVYCSVGSIRSMDSIFIELCNTDLALTDSLVSGHYIIKGYPELNTDELSGYLDNHSSRVSIKGTCLLSASNVDITIDIENRHASLHLIDYLTCCKLYVYGIYSIGTAIRTNEAYINHCRIDISTSGWIQGDMEYGTWYSCGIEGPAIINNSHISYNRQLDHIRRSTTVSYDSVSVASVANSSISGNGYVCGSSHGKYCCFLGIHNVAPEGTVGVLIVGSKENRESWHNVTCNYEPYKSYFNRSAVSCTTL